MSPATKKLKRLVLLDAHAILHRAYHALPEFASKKGEPTGALYGLSAMLIKLIADLKPYYIVACYDMPGPTFRHEAYEAYKAKRPKAESDLIHQMNRSRDIFRAFHIPIYEKTGFEADDILGTIVAQLDKELSKKELEIIIASGDMDTLQLVSGDRVRVYTLKKGINDTILYDEDAVRKRFEFGPELLPDYKGLKGDPSDNIIGISGIGEKTAVGLIKSFGTLEELYKKLKKNPQSLIKKGIKERVLRLLTEGEEEALFSKTLATIRKDVPIVFELPQKRWEEELSLEDVESLFGELSFRSLLDRLRRTIGVEEEQKSKVKTKETGMTPMGLKETALALWLLDSNSTNPTEEDILAYANTDSLVTAQSVIFKKLQENQKLEYVYKEIEIPLIRIFEKAETRGIVVDVPYLEELSKMFHKKLDTLQEKIWKEAGIQFNINSPKQLGEILFDRLLLRVKGLKKTEGGARSTRESELEKLKGSHPVIEHILAYRELQKLLSTYIDNLSHMADKENRLHTTFVQTGTTTGRIASINPNMQNIPVKGEYGKEIRRAFCAGEGFMLAAFDYSQIELRILAVLSKDEDFINIFKSGKDIHSAVASEVFGLSEADITKDMRRQAKVINFGIIYGMGVTSLQKALGGTREEAQKFYDNYFKEFPGVAEYITHIKREAAKVGYTETLFGRRRSIEGIHSHIPYIRAAAERMAVNAPIQGSAADVIKIAMRRVEEMLAREKMKDSVHLLLQVHDELLYEIDESVLKKAVPLIKSVMEGVLQSEIPFDVEATVGENWGGMKKSSFT